ncbi:hypothetical protein D9M68_648080 [compost metagenome]
MLVLAALQHVTLGVHVAFLCRPEHQGADGVGEARTGNGVAFLLQLGRGGVVGREEDLEGSAVLDLGIELAGGAIGGDQLVAGVLLEILGDGLDRRGEVGGDSHLDFRGRCAAQGEQGEERGGGAGNAMTHGMTPCCGLYVVFIVLGRSEIAGDGRGGRCHRYLLRYIALFVTSRNAEGEIP